MDGEADVGSLVVFENLKIAEAVNVPTSAIIFSAAHEVIRACAGLDRGIVASTADVTQLLTAVEAFETLAPCDEATDLMAQLEGEWTLIYSSSLAEQSTGMPSSEQLARYATTLVDAPTARSRQLSIGEVSQHIKGSSVEETVSLSLRVPWPLPPAPALEVTFKSKLEAPLDGSVRLQPESVAMRVRGTGNRAATLPVGELREAIRNALPAPMANLPMTKEVTRIDEASRQVEISAIGGGVRVTRSQLGELRVFARSDATDADGNVGGGMGAGAFEELASMRVQVDTAKKALEASEARAAAAASAAAAELDQALELAEARAAAARAVAGAELAQAVSDADDKLSAMLDEAAAVREEQAAAHRQALEEAETRALAALAEAQQVLELAVAKAEEEAAAARKTFLQEKQELSEKLMQANERAAAAKAAAVAAISNL